MSDVERRLGESSNGLEFGDGQMGVAGKGGNDCRNLKGSRSLSTIARRQSAILLRSNTVSYSSSSEG